MVKVNLIPCSAATSLNFYGDPINLEHQFHPLMLREEQCVLELTIAFAIALRIAGIFL